MPQADHHQNVVELEGFQDNVQRKIRVKNARATLHLGHAMIARDVEVIEI